MMKKKYFIIAAAVFPIMLFSQLGINTNNPKATFDINPNSTDGSKAEGFIAPRLTGDQVKAADSRYTEDQLGTLIFATSAVSTVTPGSKTENITAAGYYFYDGNKWLKVASSAGAVYNGSTSINLNGSSFERAALTGDATAAANSNTTTVVGLQGKPLSPAAPQSDDLLSYNGATWMPVSSAVLGIPKQILSVSVAGNQSLTGGGGSSTISFPIENFDLFNSWNIDTFTVPNNYQGTYTVNTQLANLHTAAGSTGNWWIVLIMYKSIDNGATWTRMISDTRSGLAATDVDNGNILFWTGNLNPGDKLRITAQYGGNTSNIVRWGNLAIIKL